jgi:glutamine synthetase
MEAAAAWAVSTPLRSRAQREAAAAHATQLLPSLRERGVRQVAITFVNHAGSALAKAVPLRRLPLVASDGVGFSPVADAFGPTGLVDPLQSLACPDGDLRLVPAMESLRLLDGPAGWAWVAGERYECDGAPYAADQRLFARRWQDTLAAQNLQVQAGFEIEWMVAPPEAAAGAWSAAVPGGPYGADRLVAGLDYLNALAEALDAAGLDWLQLHPEYGDGQFELSMAPAPPLAAADQLVVARLLIQRVTQRFGWLCSFSPVVTADRVGNGGHLHLSVCRGGLPLLSGGEGVAGLSGAGEALLAGLLHELPALLPLACALEISYQRLIPSRWAAPFQVWGVENREAALRLIPAGLEGEPAHLELKVADLSANPYLLVGAVLAVVDAALRQPLSHPHPHPLPLPVVGDPAHVAGGGAAPRLPATLEQAAAAFAASALLRQAMGEPLHRTVLETRLAEVRRAAALVEAERIASTRLCPSP